MYVGPWQEYAIARSRKSNETKSKLTSKFKEDLENAMINSLDPVSAARAMKAMEKVMDRSEVPFAIDGELVGGGQKKRRAPKVVAGQHNLAAYKLQLPSVSPGSAHSQGYAGDRSTPNSVRTSASEPLDVRRRSDHMISPRVKARQNRMPGSGDDFDDNASTNSAISQISIKSKSGMNDSSVVALENGGGGGGQSYETLAEHLRRIPNVPANLPKVDSGLGAVSPEATRRHELEKKWGNQPPYNASAAVTALRLAKAGQPKPMLTYSGYWEWSKQGGPRLLDMGAGDMTDRMTDRIGSSEEMGAGVVGGMGRAGRVQSKREEDIINKVERVKRMQQVYHSGKEGISAAAAGGGGGGGGGGYMYAGSGVHGAAEGLDAGVSESTAPPTPLLTQYQHFDPTKPGTTDSPLATAKKSYEKKPHTPKVTEMDLTDQQLTMISKYFPDQRAEGGPPGGTAAGVHESMMMQAQGEDGSAYGYADYDDEDKEVSSSLSQGQEQGWGSPPPSMTIPGGLASISGESPRESPVQLSPVGIGVQVKQREASSGRHRVFSDAITITTTAAGGATVPEPVPGPGAGSASASASASDSASAMDELYTGGGAENLLDWSAKLDVDSL